MSGSNEGSTSPTRSSRSGSAYELAYQDHFSNELVILPKDLQIRVIAKLEEAAENPFHYFSRLVGRGEYSLRVGDYRVIVSIEDSLIKVHTIGHRKNIYEK